MLALGFEVPTMKSIAAIGVCLTLGLAWAAEPQVQRILDRFEKAKPDATSLAFYSLDWSPNLKEAQARAKKERRPVLLIANTNISAGCNFYTGHT